MKTYSDEWLNYYADRYAALSIKRLDVSLLQYLATPVTYDLADAVMRTHTQNDRHRRAVVDCLSAAQRPLTTRQIATEAMVPVEAAQRVVCDLIIEEAIVSTRHLGWFGVPIPADEAFRAIGAAANGDTGPAYALPGKLLQRIEAHQQPPQPKTNLEDAS
ncbi:MAG: hypothetical protein RQ757_07105 [Pseudomonadales bacterium]|nr:hypothetical protein [Pseudomonadales bacterium]